MADAIGKIAPAGNFKGNSSKTMVGADEKIDGLDATGLGTIVQECIFECNNCTQVCYSTLDYCLKLGGEHADSKHVNLLLDCARLCELAVSSMLRESPIAKDLCQLCVYICRRCADDCDKFEDEVMKTCAVICRKCAQACEAMI